MRSNFTYWIIKSAPIIGPVVDWLDAHESQCSTEVAFTVRPWKATLDTLLGGGGGGQHCMQMSGSAAHRWTLVSLTYLMLPLSVLPLKRALGYQQSDVDVIHWFQPLDKRRPWLSPGRNQNWARWIVFIYSFHTGMHTIVQRYSSLVRPRLRVHYVPVSTARTQRLYVVLRSPAEFLQNPTVATGRHGCLFSTVTSVRLKTCGKSERRTGRSPSSLVALWPSCRAVCARAGSSFGTPTRRLEPCWVIDKRLGSVMMELSALLCGFLLAEALPTHSETHQNATSPLIRPQFLFSHRPALLLLSFVGTVQAREMMMGTHGPRVYKKSTLAKCASAGERDQTFRCQGRK